MIIALGLLCLTLVVLLIVIAGKADRAEKLAAQRATEVAAAKRDTQLARQDFESATTRIQSEAEAAVSRAQQQVDQQLAEIPQERERVRQHFEAQARRVQVEAEAAYAKLLKDVEALRKYEGVRDAEGEVKRLLADAVKEATSLRGEAQALMEQARVVAANERSAAVEKAKDIHEQADARLNQALIDAGRIVAEAEKRAEQIAGEAYTALRDKQLLEQAAEAMRNTIEGYGDRYLLPTHSLLDDLAVEYGYDAAGQSLASARDQSRRMVEQGQAAACDYVEASRRNTAIQFVIHAFNGSVDATLTRVKSDNYGTLEQRIRDCYAIVNREGSAFRNARILPAYLDARLAELKWAVIVQELALRDREEQRFLKDRARDEELARRENEKKIREAEKEEELKRLAVEEAKKSFNEEAAKLIEQHKQELDEARKIGSSAVEEAEKRHANEIAELNEKNKQQLAEKDQQLKEATEHKLTIAQLTKVGRIYIISNVGSFGEGVFKIGFTRRTAKERVDELNSASVPFEFDIHAEITTDKASDLESKLHQQFLAMRMNKINLRKEFFRVTLDDIRRVVDNLEQGKDVIWTEKAKAEQWRATLDHERDAQAKEEWLQKAQKARILAERRNRATSRPSPSVELEADANGQET
ncbi:MAG: DUF4041 domain-containing protein [Planctomycetota bacterium]|nr:DUF4041 domain-containing protein [Planctomycetota bacterium]